MTSLDHLVPPTVRWSGDGYKKKRTRSWPQFSVEQTSMNFLTILAALLAIFVTLSVACPKNEYSRSCGSACDPTCDEPDPICIQMCVERCECKPGFVRDLVTKECFEISKCPQKDSH